MSNQLEKIFGKEELIKDSQIDNKYRQQTFDFYSENLSVGEFLRTALSSRTKKIILAIIFIFLGIITGRLAYLQIFKGNYFLTVAEENRIQFIIIPAPRGIFYDQQGTPLVKNTPRFIFQNKEITYQEATQLILKNEEQKLEIKTKREYLYPNSLFHLLGYLSDGVGKSGLEKYAEEQLAGQAGKKEIEVDALGNEQRIIAEKEPIAGEDITLTINVDLQNQIYTVLEKMVQEKKVPGAAAVALDPRNGEILALASYPSSDSNKLTEGLSEEETKQLLSDIHHPLFFRAIAGQYPPGSTLKPLIAAAALQEAVINPQTTVMSTGGLQIDKWFFPDWKAGGHGSTDVRKAIAESVNTFFYLAGGGDNAEQEGLGVKRITEYAAKFGLGQKTGIEIEGEEEGFLPSKEWKEKNKGEPWYIGDTYHLSIGQGDILVTPLQLANYIAAVANGGTLFKPHLMGGEEIINSNFIEQKNLEIVRQGMRQAVTAGSAQALQSLSVSSAAKTGTAQAPEEGKLHSWLVAFAPYENPEIVLAVIIEEGGESTAAALPAAKTILDWYF